MEVVPELYGELYAVIVTENHRFSTVMVVHLLPII